jgi:cytochrome c oxidase subunit 2
LYQANRELSDGSVVVADENYLRESIVYPKAKIVAGYQPVMPAYAGLLSDREISALIEYIKEIK